MKKIKLMLTLLVTSIILYSCTTTSKKIELLQKEYPNSIVYKISTTDCDFIVIDSCNSVRHIIVTEKTIHSTVIIKPCDKNK